MPKKVGKHITSKELAKVLEKQGHKFVRLSPMSPKQIESCRRSLENLRKFLAKHEKYQEETRKS